MVTIKNLRTEKPTEVYHVVCDRTSVLGNPFKMEESEREKSIAMYRIYFNKRVEENGSFLLELRRLYKLHQKHGQLVLFCWCSPKRCHTEVIKEFLERFIK